jgi:threonine dehydrogenase-like Zn-dependent dehydrogenase
LGKNKVEVGDFLVVMGCGPIGLLAGQVAKAAGASKVMITGRKSAVKTRFRVARETGAFDFIVNVEDEDPVRIVMEATGGKGADIIFDTTGSSAALNQGIEMVRRGGLVEVIGFGDKTVSFPLERMIREVIRVHYCRGTNYRSFEIFCALAAAGKLSLKPLVSSEYPLADWQKGFESTESRDSVKTLLIP